MMWTKGIRHSADRVLGMLATLFMVYMNNHMKPSRVFLYTTDTTKKPQGPVSLLLNT